MILISILRRIRNKKVNYSKCIFLETNDQKIIEDEKDQGMNKKEVEIHKELKLFLDNLKTLLGEYLARRKESKFEIIENVMRMNVFENKKGEIKYLEDALGHTKASNSLSNLLSTMRTKGMLLSQGKFENLSKFSNILNLKYSIY